MNRTSLGKDEIRRIVNALGTSSEVGSLQMLFFVGSCTCWHERKSDWVPSIRRG